MIFVATATIVSLGAQYIMGKLMVGHKDHESICEK